MMNKINEAIEQLRSMPQKNKIILSFAVILVLGLFVVAPLVMWSKQLDTERIAACKIYSLNRINGCQ